MKFKTEPLDLLKVIIHQENLRENRTAAAADHLCTVHLQTHASKRNTVFKASAAPGSFKRRKTELTFTSDGFRVFKSRKLCISYDCKNDTRLVP